MTKTAVCMLAALLAGCAGGPSHAPGTPPVPARMVAESESGSTIAVQPGRKVTVRMEARRSAGYRWSLAASGDALEQLGEPFYTEEKVAGGDGAEYWSFMAKRSGRQDLKFEYRRPWEKDKPADRTLSYTVDVR